jgi:hypothetical protein
MDAWYLTDSVFTFYYQNTKNTSASILFTFQYDTSEYCHQIETDFVTYKIGVNGSSASYVGPTPVTLNFLDTLFVQQHVSMDTCLTTCPEDTAIFSWTCNYNQATLSSFCEACQNEYVHVYDVKNEDNLSVDFIRIVPSDPIYDFSCMNDTAEFGGSIRLLMMGSAQSIHCNFISRKMLLLQALLISCHFCRFLQSL